MNGKAEREGIFRRKNKHESAEEISRGSETDAARDSDVCKWICSESISNPPKRAKFSVEIDFLFRNQAFFSSQNGALCNDDAARFRVLGTWSLFLVRLFANINLVSLSQRRKLRHRVQGRNFQFPLHKILTARTKQRQIHVKDGISSKRKQKHKFIARWIFYPVFVLVRVYAFSLCASVITRDTHCANSALFAWTPADEELQLISNKILFKTSGDQTRGGVNAADFRCELSQSSSENIESPSTGSSRFPRNIPAKHQTRTSAGEEGKLARD